MLAPLHRFTETRILSESERQEVNSSSSTNTLTFLISSGSITIYVPRAFQRIFSNPPIRPLAKKNAKRVRPARNVTMSDIRSSRSSGVTTSRDPFKPWSQEILCT